MVKQRLVDAILTGKLSEAKEHLGEAMESILKDKLTEFKKIIAARDYTIEHMEEDEEPEELDEANVTKMGRMNLIRVRIRKGKVQRRKKVSGVKGFRVQGGKLKRMTAQERRRRKLGSRKAKIKRRSKRAQSRMKLRRSLRKRKSLGISSSR